MVQRLSRNLRLKGQQWQFVKKLKPALRKITGKTWLIKNLGTADLIVDNRLRDMLESELRNLNARARPHCGSNSIPLRLSDCIEKGAMSGNIASVTLRPKSVTIQSTPISSNFERYLRECPAVATTQFARRSAINRFAACLPDTALEAITRRRSGEYVSFLTNSSLAANTVNSHVSHLSAYWRWLEKRGIIASNPWAGQQLEKKHKTKRLA